MLRATDPKHMCFHAHADHGPNYNNPYVSGALWAMFAGKAGGFPLRRDVLWIVYALEDGRVLQNDGKKEGRKAIRALAQVGEKRFENIVVDALLAGAIKEDAEGEEDKEAVQELVHGVTKMEDIGRLVLTEAFATEDRGQEAGSGG